MTDAQWQAIEPLIPPAKPGGHPRTVDIREIVNAISYVTRSGCDWQYLPHDLPAWGTVWYYFRKWRRDGTWQKIQDALRIRVRRAAGRAESPRATILDSKSFKTPGKQGLVATTPARRSRATSIHIADIRRQEEERQALGQVAQALVRELTLERVADVIVEQAQRVLRAQRVAVYFANLERRELRLLAQRGFSAQTVAEVRILPFTAPLLSTLAARTGQPQEISDSAAVGPELSMARRISEREALRGAILSRPLFAKGRLVGVLSFVVPTLHSLTAEERGLIRAFADLCAAAIDNARLYEESRETLQLREEFISAAAHELKTPVTAIKGYVQAMNKWAPRGHEPHEAIALDVINRQCDRINRRVEEMLEAVRLRHIPPERRHARFDLGDMASEVVQRLQVTTPLHRLVLQCEGAASVEADRERIEEVLVGFLDNAVKFSPGGGDVEVRVFTLDGEAIVAVTDHGVGVPKERQPHVFEPFYDIVPTGAPGYRGVVPLSLYLSKLAIELHAGRIWLETEEGRGSTFYFSLPLAADGDSRPTDEPI